MRRHALAAIYVPLGAFVAFGIVVAVTGIRQVQNLEEVGSTLAGSSLVLVFAHLATRDLAGAPQNVRTLAGLCLSVLAVASFAGGGWREPGFWFAGVAIATVLVGAAAFIGLRWARRYERWKMARSNRRSEPGGDTQVTGDG